MNTISIQIHHQKVWEDKKSYRLDKYSFKGTIDRYLFAVEKAIKATLTELATVKFAITLNPVKRIKTTTITPSEDIPLSEDQLQLIHEIINSTEVYYVPLKSMSLEQFTESLERGNRDFSLCGFSEVIFDRINMDDLLFRESSFMNCVFYDCPIQDCSFNSTYVFMTDFQNCTMIDCNFQEMYAVGINWLNSTLSRICLLDAVIPLGRSEHSALSNIDCNHARLKGFKFHSTTLNHIGFDKSNLSQASFDFCELYACDFSQADLQETDFRNTANMLASEFDGANLNRAHGIYRVFGLRLSSRVDSLYGGIQVNDETNTVELFFDAGCQSFLSEQELRDRLQLEHGVTYYAAQYIIGIETIKRLFALDLDQNHFAHLTTIKG